MIPFTMQKFVPPRTNNGFTYTALLAGIVIMGIMLGSAGKYWSATVLREKEAELLFRGDQYRQAIERYRSLGGRNQYPASIEDLLKDSRTVDGKRHLRKKYTDPITNEDFVEIRDAFKRIIGVHSSSDKEPLKQGDFPEAYPEFNNAKKYSDWKFQVQHLTAPQPPAAPRKQGASHGGPG